MIVNLEAPRGLYLLYENYLIQELGITVGGTLHTARSRNDINATLFKLKLRKLYFNCSEILWRLRSKIITKANETQDIAFPIYSQYQTALPGTFAHYLLGIEVALTRDQASLNALLPLLDECPLGAGAGGGTTFNIDSSITCKLLGFFTVATNSLDAVASRDLALRALASLSILGMTLSRITEDLQLWSTNEFKFIELPDNLCGSSSMMPQKKNPYLLEKIKGMIATAAGCFTSSSMLMNKVPFGNSVEVGTEAVKDINLIFKNIENAITLLGLHIDYLTLNTKSIEKSIKEHLTIATYITDILIREQNYSLREAHHLVGNIIRESLEIGKDPLNEILALIPNYNMSMHSPIKWAHAMEFGGGAGKYSTRIAIENSTENLNKEAEKIKLQKAAYDKADALREAAINSLLSNERVC